ncbi:MAG: RsmE family RNA methyltransferase [Candidatus Aminicenantes bacterium]|nr:RsmE family RNA methyltransferase [Candidatus Aminicenantes bacterium]
MTANRFFIQKKNINHDKISLSGKEHHHLIRVLRKKNGARVVLFDEAGESYEAVVMEEHKARTVLQLVGRQKPPAGNLKITLAQAVLQGRKLDTLVRQGTEFGIFAFAPVFTQRSLAGLENRSEKKVERWRKIAVEAAKQSGQTRLPLLFEPVPLEKYLKTCRDEERYFLSERGGLLLRDVLLRHPDRNTSSPPLSVTLLCGPEGGWTEEEEGHIVECRFSAVSLGSSILRAETAAIGSIAAAMLFWDGNHVSSGTKSR